jgi:gas vesicle protein
MKEIKVRDLKGNGYYNIIRVGDFEYVNPIKKMSEVIIQSIAQLANNQLMFAKENNLLPNINAASNADAIIKKASIKEGVKAWQEEFQNIKSQKLPDNILNILNSASKKEQMKILKGISLTSEELMLFIFKAWEDYGFTYSSYSSDHSPNGLDNMKMPNFAYKEENGDITSIGETNLTHGQIKQAIDHRTVIVSKFLDKGPLWHCFFQTYKSLKGEENYKDGQPHLHFISHTWGLSREYVLQQLRSKNYKLSSLPHIDFHTYRNPRKKG